MPLRRSVTRIWGRLGFALVEDAEVFEEVDVVEHDVGVVGQDFVPVLATWVGYRSIYQAEIASCVIDADVEEVAVMVGIIFDALLARLDNLPLSVGLGGGTVAGFGSGVAGGNQENSKARRCES